MSFGEGDILDPLTMRGRDWPTLRQFCVFLENHVGALHDLLRRFEGHEIRVVALSIANSVDCAIIRLMLNNSDRGREILDLSGLTYSESDLVGVELPMSSQPYVEICIALLQAELSIHYTYPLLFRRGGHGAIALYVDDVDLAMKTLKDKGLRLISERDLLDHDDEMY